MFWIGTVTCWCVRAEGLWHMRRHGPVIVQCTNSVVFPQEIHTNTCQDPTSARRETIKWIFVKYYGKTTESVHCTIIGLCLHHGPSACTLQYGTVPIQNIYQYDVIIIPFVSYTNQRKHGLSAESDGTQGMGRHCQSMCQMPTNEEFFCKKGVALQCFFVCTLLAGITVRHSRHHHPTMSAHVSWPFITLRAGCTHLTKWLTKWLTIWLAVDALLVTLILG